jgi:hypothetical protein
VSCLGRTQAANLLGVVTLPACLLVNQTKPDSNTKAQKGIDYLEFQLNLTVVTERPLASQLIIGARKRDYTSLLARANAVPSGINNLPREEREVRRAFPELQQSSLKSCPFWSRLQLLFSLNDHLVLRAASCGARDPSPLFSPSPHHTLHV